MYIIREDEQIGGITHVRIEISLGNSLCSYLYLKVAKIPCFPFYLLSFLFCKIREQEGGTGSAQGEGLAPV
jgi:hypothetical protein